MVIKKINTGKIDSQLFLTVKKRINYTNGILLLTELTIFIHLNKSIFQEILQSNETKKDHRNTTNWYWC